MANSNKSVRIHLAILAGVWLAMTLVQIIGVPLLPEDIVYFRAWEYVVATDRPFKPMAVWQGQAVGDLANMTGLPQMRDSHPQTFTVDEYGFRNPPGQYARNPQVVLVGDSFAAGSQVSDEQTLTVLIERELGLTAYNEATLLLGNFACDKRFIDKPPLVVIAYYVERDLSSKLFAVDPNAKPFTIDSYPSLADYSQAKETGLRQRWREMNKNIVSRSPFIVFGEGLLKGTLWKLGLYALPDKIYSIDPQTGFILYRDGVTLHQHPEAKLAELPSIRQTLVEADEYFRRRGIKLIVIVAPDKETVYHRMIPEIRDRNVYEILDRFTAELDAAGIANVKVHRVFADALQSNPQEPIYWPGDTHLTAYGTRLLFDALQSQLLDAVQPNK